MNRGELLRDFTEHGREEAFHALVHGVAWRRTGDRRFTEEIAQNVFIAFQLILRTAGL